MANKKVVVALVILGVVVLTFLLRWNSLASPFERDEGEYAYSARLLLRGQLPYRESFLQKPPLIIYTYAVGQVISGDQLWGPRLLALLFIVATSLLTGYIAYREYGWLVGTVTSFLLPFMLSSPYLAALAANTEVFMVLPLMGAVATYRSIGDMGAIWGSILAGLLAVLAIMYKPIAILPLSFLFLVWWWERRQWRELAWVGVGGILGCVGGLGYFIWRGGWSYFWEEVVVFNSAYAAQFGLNLGNLWLRLQSLWGQWWALFLLLGWFLFKRPTRWWFYTGLLVTSLLAVYQSPIGHYYLLLMPFWALAAAWAMVDFCGFVKKWGVWGKLGIGGTVFLLMFTPVREQFAKTPAEITSWIYGRGNPFAESQVVAEKLAVVTKPTDKVLVAGSEPQIYYYANRESASRFVITYPLIIDTSKRLEYQQEAVAKLAQNPPAAIVISQREESGLWNQESPRVFIDYLNELLRKEYKLVGGFVWSARGGEWREKLSSDDIKNASLLLFKRS